MDESYRRSQIEWALWRFSVLGRPADREPSHAFRASIKNLLQIDRSGHTREQRPITTLDAEGTGTEAAYLPFDAFCLGIALDLTRFGFKQREVLLLLTNLRSHLKPVFSEILASPPPFPSHLNRDGTWKTVKAQRSNHTDRRFFLVFLRVDLSEEFPALKPSKSNAKAPIFREPQICRGLNELAATLDNMDHRFRRVFVLEIGQTAARVTEFLEEAPIVKRGRK